jgi:uncharacterized protein YxjI
MVSRSEKQLTMRIKDKMISIDRVYEAQRHLSNVLHEIDKSKNLQKKTTVSWIVTDAQSGSYSVTIEGVGSNLSDIADKQIAGYLESLDTGLKLLDREAIRPPFFSDSLLQSVKALGKFSVDGAGIELLNERFGVINLTQEITLNVEKLIDAKYKSFGSVEGRLNVIDVRGKLPLFKITDPLTLGTIECRFDIENLEKAKEALGKRVYVYGQIWAREDGTRIKIDVDRDEIDIFPSEDELPSIKAISGLWKE